MRSATFEVSSAGKLIIFCLSSNSSVLDRSVIVGKYPVTLAADETHYAPGSADSTLGLSNSKLEYNLTEGGKYQIATFGGAVNLYRIFFIPSGVEVPEILEKTSNYLIFNADSVTIGTYTENFVAGSLTFICSAEKAITVEAKETKINNKNDKSVNRLKLGGVTEKVPDFSIEPECGEHLICIECGHEFGGFTPHNLTKHNAKEATCLEAGNIEYWTCSNCLKYFSDELGEHEISASSINIAIKNHVYGTYTHIENTNTHKRTCSACLNDEISNCTFVDEVISPTSTDDGYTKHTCSACGYFYTDTPVENLSTTQNVSNFDDLVLKLSMGYLNIIVTQEITAKDNSSITIGENQLLVLNEALTIPSNFNVSFINNGTFKIPSSSEINILSGSILTYSNSGEVELYGSLNNNGEIDLIAKSYADIYEGFAMADKIILNNDISFLDSNNNYIGDLTISSKNRDYCVTIDLNGYDILGTLEFITGNNEGDYSNSLSVEIIDNSADNCGTIGTENSLHSLIYRGAENSSLTISNVNLVALNNALFMEETLTQSEVSLTGCNISSVGTYSAAEFKGNNIYNINSCEFSGACGAVIINGEFSLENCQFLGNSLTESFETNLEGELGVGLSIISNASELTTIFVEANECSFSSVASYGIEQKCKGTIEDDSILDVAISLSYCTFNNCFKGNYTSQNDTIEIYDSNLD